MEQNYYKQYLKRIKARYPLKVRRLYPGQIIEFRYGKDIKQLAFILNPKWKLKTHVLKLNEIPLVYFDQLFDKFVAEDDDIIKENYRYLATPVDNIIRRPTLFYKSLVKTSPFVKKYEPYRTYNFNDLKSIQLIWFDFDHHLKFVEDLPPLGEKIL